MVLKDPWFDWLHRLSELIVQIDETLDNRDPEQPTTEEDAKALVTRAKSLLAPSESGTEFQKNYFLALQQSPDVVLLHAELMRLLGKEDRELSENVSHLIDELFIRQIRGFYLS